MSMVLSADKQSTTKACIDWHLHSSSAVWLSKEFCKHMQVLSKQREMKDSISTTFAQGDNDCSLKTNKSVNTNVTF